MIAVYSPAPTSRLRYILDFIGKELSDEPLTIYDSPEAFKAADGFKINYSHLQFSENFYRVIPVDLLFEEDVKQQDPEVFNFEEGKAFFGTNGDFPFDIFAASFYLISRYEEYLPHSLDEYGRYSHKDSLAFREGFLDQPMVNIWLQAFRKSLTEFYPSIILKHQHFNCMITYDIDIAWSYKYKGFVRTVSGFAKDLFKGQWKALDDRWLVLRGEKQDPYDCFEWLDALHLYCRLKPHYFFLVAKKQVGYDKNISTDVKQFRELVEYYAGRYDAGIHPSWQSGDNKKLLKEELEWLEVIADKPVQSSRQHYIRFKTPDTFRNLIERGIMNEYSMGYGTINGFRASVCSSYKWFDLVKNEATELNMHPYCFMDANSFFEQLQTPGQTYQELLGYYEKVKKVNGTMISIWHNHMLGTDPKFAGWPQMFELFMRETVYWDAYS